MECQDRSTMYFNPRSHEGSDKILHILHNIISIFQSTLPRRERLPISNERSRKITFQSTLPRRERQSRAYQYCLWAIISIHAPTKGATRDIAAFDAYLRDFNPRSHEGSDLTFWTEIPYSIISIHAPTKGATYSGSLFSADISYFNPRSHEGSDSNIIQ